MGKFNFFDTYTEAQKFKNRFPTLQIPFSPEIESLLGRVWVDGGIPLQQVHDLALVQGATKQGLVYSREGQLRATIPLLTKRRAESLVPKLRDLAWKIARQLGRPLQEMGTIWDREVEGSEPWGPPAWELVSHGVVGLTILQTGLRLAWRCAEG